MRKAILMMLLAVVSSSAAAEWVAISSSSDGTITVYVDPAAIRRTGDTAKMWQMTDNKVTEEVEKGKPYKSIKFQYDFDCKEERLRQLYLSAHAGSMGDGETVFRDSNPYKWEPIPPDSPLLRLWKIACGK